MSEKGCASKTYNEKKNFLIVAVKILNTYFSIFNYLHLNLF